MTDGSYQIYIQDRQLRVSHKIYVYHTKLESIIPAWTMSQHNSC